MANAGFPNALHQRGIALFVSLMVLVIITLLGVAIARTQFAGERMAQNALDHAIAVQAAEAALREAEANLAAGSYATTAFAANTSGLYQFVATSPSAYLGINWASPAAGSTITYGTAPIPGPALTTPIPVPSPVYIIELLPSVIPTGGSLTNPQPTPVYRITAYGVGADSNTHALLQSIYR